MSYTYAVLNSSDYVVEIQTPPSSFNANSLVAAGVWVNITSIANVAVGDVYSGGTFSVPPGGTYGSGSIGVTYMPVYANTVIDTSTVVIANGSSYISGNVFTVPPSCTTVIMDVTPPVSNGLNTISFLALNQTTGSQRILITGVGNSVTFTHTQANTAVVAPANIIVGNGYYEEVLYAPTANVTIFLQTLG